MLKEFSEEIRHAAIIDELHVQLGMAALPAALEGVLLEALAAPGKLLGSPPGSRWPDIVLACCAAAGGSWSMALPAALAAEFLALALDLLDEIEDDDPSPLRDHYGAPIVLNCSTALLGMAQLAVAHLSSRAAPARRILRCHEVMARAMATAAGGQHLDLSAETGAALTQREIQDLVARKSGALVGGSCALGAAVAGADEATMALFSEFGCHVGMAAQIDNDMHDLWSVVAATVGDGKSDLRRGKQTVPLAFLRDSLGKVQPEQNPGLAEQLWETGALPYAWALVQAHREKARDILHRIDTAGRQPGLAISLLGEFMGRAAQPTSGTDPQDGGEAR